MARPRTFDEDDVLDRAIEVFSRHGFAGVGIDQLTDELGLSRSSIYGAFGSKQDLWLRAVDRYRLQALAEIRNCLESPESGQLMERVLDLLQAIGTDVSAEGGTCLMVSAACERGTTDVATAQRASAQFCDVANVLRAALRTAQVRGELRADADVEGLSALIGTVINGARVSAAVGDPDRLGQQAIDQVIGLLTRLRA